MSFSKLDENTFLAFERIIQQSTDLLVRADHSKKVGLYVERVYERPQHIFPSDRVERIADVKRDEENRTAGPVVVILYVKPWLVMHI